MPSFKFRMCKVIIAILALSISSCATIYSGQKQWVEVITDVPGAVLSINNKVVNTTPCVIKLERKRKAPIITLNHPNFKEQKLFLETKWNETTALNNVILPFWAVDNLTGSWIKYRPLDTIVLQNPRN